MTVRPHLLRRAVTLALFGLALASARAHAQGGVWTQVPVPGGPVFAVADGDSGRVLIAGNNGAFRFDGFRMKRLPIFSTTADSLKGNAILQAHDGAIWFGTLTGVSRLATDGTVARFDATNGLGNSSISEVTCLAEDAAGTIWAGTSGGGLSRYDGAAWTTITTDQGLPSMIVSSIAVDPTDQSVWAGTTGLSGGLAHVVGGAVVAEYHTFTLTASRNVRGVVAVPSGEVWFGIDGGIVRLEQGILTEYPASGSTVSSLAAGAGGEFWFGTSTRGIGRLDDGRAVFFPSGPPSNSVQGLFVDAAGVLWASTSGGLGRYEGAAWLPIAQATGQPPGFAPLAAIREPAPFDSIDARGVTWIGMQSIPGVGTDVLTVARRVNGGMRFFGTANGLPLAPASSLAPADSGQAWLGFTSPLGSGGVARIDLDGIVRRFESASLPSADVFALDAAGAAAVWVGTRLGPALIDPAGVHALPVRAGAVPDAPVRGIDVDPQGRVWIATGLTLTAAPDGRTGQGAVRFDPADSSYLALGTVDGLPTNNLTAVAAFGNGDVWFGSSLGAARWRAGSITRFTNAQGLPSNLVTRIAEGRDGAVWIATSGGLVLFDGANFTVFGVADGMNGSTANDVFADSSGALVSLKLDGLSLDHADRTPPQAEILTAPPPASGSRDAQFAVRGGDLDSGTRGILLSSQLDNRPRTPYEEVTSAQFTDLPDGEHVFRLWAKDRALNVTADPETWTFTVDATAPRPIVSKPAFDSIVRGTVDVVGSVADPRFAFYTVELRPVGQTAWDTLFVSGTVPSDTLYRWDTTARPDGVWELRVGTTDSLGLNGYVSVKVVVDNLAPGAGITAPAKVDHVLGGKVFTTDGGVEVDIPPNAFAADQIVFIDPILPPNVPPAGPPGAIPGPAYRIHATDMTLDKPAAVTFRLSFDSNAPAAIYRVEPDTSFVRIGGIRNQSTISTTLSSLGDLIVLFGIAPADGAGFDGVRALDVQPRVLSPNGGGFETRAAVSFEVGKGGSGAVKVFDRAGRLVREVSENDQFAQGRNVVFWDGRDGDGQVVPSGIYVVAVRFDGQTQVASIAVANR
jgi:ligand-binding sensor domain-containing protein